MSQDPGKSTEIASIAPPGSCGIEGGGWGVRRRPGRSRGSAKTHNARYLLNHIASLPKFSRKVKHFFGRPGMVHNEFLMGKNGTGWDVLGGSPSQLATFANEIPRRSAADWVIVISRLSIGSCVVKFGRFQPLSSPANRAAESPRRDSSSIEMSHVPAPQICCVPAKSVRATKNRSSA